jgi:hypothetical protein
MRGSPASQIKLGGTRVCQQATLAKHAVSAFAEALSTIAQLESRGASPRVAFCHDRYAIISIAI